KIGSIAVKLSGCETLAQSVVVDLAPPSGHFLLLGGSGETAAPTPRCSSSHLGSPLIGTDGSSRGDHWQKGSYPFLPLTCKHFLTYNTSVLEQRSQVITK